jgi:hypothetical protein
LAAGSAAACAITGTAQASNAAALAARRNTIDTAGLRDE